MKISLSFSFDQSFIFDTLYVCYENVMDVVINQIADFNHSFGSFGNLIGIHNQGCPDALSVVLKISKK